jgi:hypothetical protein
MDVNIKTSVMKIVKLLETIPENEHNLCLVVEAPRVGYKDSYRPASNPNIGINIGQWQYISDLHVVMPNVCQLYLFRTLEWKNTIVTMTCLFKLSKPVSLTSKFMFTLL